MGFCPRARVLLVLALLALPARAEPSAEDKALSAELFKEGRRLMEQGEIGEACAKLAESERLVPADGTFLNLAVCHEKLGKTATAYAAFTEARARARAAKQKDRVAFAERHIADLEKKLSRLIVLVPSEVDLPNLRVYRDGSEIRRAAWGTAMPVDPGEHWIEARAEGKKLWRQSVEVGPDADQKSIELTALEPEEAPKSEAPPPPVTPPPVAPPATRAPAPPPDRKVDSGSGDGQRLIAYALGGVGVIGVGIGSYFGLRAFSQWSDSSDACPNGRCTADGAEAAKDARTSADISTVGFAIGGVALAAGTWLFLTSGSNSSAETRSSALWFGAGVERGGASTTLGGRF